MFSLFTVVQTLNPPVVCNVLFIASKSDFAIVYFYLNLHYLKVPHLSPFSLLCVLSRTPVLLCMINYTPKTA